MTKPHWWRSGRATEQVTGMPKVLRLHREAVRPATGASPDA
jgi:hypothetical protein